MCTPSSSRFALLALALLALAGCPRPREDAEAYAARNAVIRYNQALVEAYRASRAELLTDVATEAEISRIAALISGLALREQYMLARQTKFAHQGTRVEASDAGQLRAEVKVRESWVYEHRSLTNRDAPVQVKTLDYVLTYLLVRQGEGWRVDEVRDETPAWGSSP